MLERLFGLRARGTTVRRELLGGATTFATMATILVAVFGTLLMGFYANRPIAVAPYKPGGAALALVCAASYVFGLPH